jgi:hypothetical protein
MTQAYINSLKPRPHFEDVVFGRRKNTQLIYPERAYIMRDSLYYGVEDKEKLQNEERVKMMDSNLKLIGQEVNMTLPQMREVMKDMLGSELPGKLKVAFDKHREAKVREEALKARDEQMKELNEKAKQLNTQRLKRQVIEGLKQNVDERDAAVRKIQAAVKKFIEPKDDPRFPPITDVSTIGDTRERLESVLNIYKRGGSTTQQKIVRKGLKRINAVEVKVKKAAFEELRKNAPAAPKAQSFSGGAAENVKTKPRKVSNK